MTFLRLSSLMKVIILFVVVESSNVVAVECNRNYQNFNYVVRLVKQQWKIGTKDVSGAWVEIPCKSNLNSNFLNGTNNQILRTEGEGHLGQFASFVFYPTVNVPKSVTFTTDPENIFGKNILEVTLPETGQVFLDKNSYEQFQTIINGIKVDIFSESTNPSKKIAIQTLSTLSHLFPERSKAIALQGKITLLIARNSIEKFQNEPIRPNGLHNLDHLFVILFSQDGSGTEEHLLHEIGGLFRIPNNKYSHGLTWMVAYDQMAILTNTTSEKRSRQCLELDRVISNIQQTATNNGNDYSHTIEYYIDDVHSRNGWPMYAWGSAFYWKKINSTLTNLKLATVYDLLEAIHLNGASALTGNNLDQLLAIYSKFKRPETFKKLVKKYFRERDLRQLLNDAFEEEKNLGCKSVKK